MSQRTVSATSTEYYTVHGTGIDLSRSHHPRTCLASVNDVMRTDAFIYLFYY